MCWLAHPGTYWRAAGTWCVPPRVRRVTATGDLDLLALLLLRQAGQELAQQPGPPEGANIGAADPRGEEAEFEEQQDGVME